MPGPRSSHQTARGVARAVEPQVLTHVRLTRQAIVVAEAHTDYAARQLAFAIAEGIDVDEELRGTARDLYEVSGRLALVDEAFVAESTAVQQAAHAGGEAPPLDSFLGLADDARTLGARADQLRRRLPRCFGDPLRREADYPDRG